MYNLKNKKERKSMVNSDTLEDQTLPQVQNQKMII